MSDASTFWERRKAAVEAEAQREAQAQEARAQAEYEASLAEKFDEDILAELNLPEPETLGVGDDFSVFMSKAVPDRLRRRALRVLWRSNPVLANVDALVDYGEDFTDAATVIEDMQTAYQVGKGMLAHIEKLAADQAASQSEASAEAAVTEAAETDGATDPLTPSAEVTDVSETTYAHFEDTQADGEDDVPSAPRRMTFTFEAEPL